MLDTPKVGSHVLYMDEVRQMQSALITAVHGTASYDENGKLVFMPCVNLVIVSNDQTKRDQYGTQIERHSSVCNTVLTTPTMSHNMVQLEEHGSTHLKRIKI